MHNKHRHRPIALLAVTLLLFAGCSNPFGSSGGSSSQSSNGDSSQGIAAQHAEFVAFATTGLPEITLHWVEPDSSITSYHVFRSESPGIINVDTDTPIATVSFGGGPEYSYVDEAAHEDTTYYYVVEALAGGSAIDTAPEISATARVKTGDVDPDFVYIDPSAPDGGNGSSDNPFNTIAAGVLAVNDGGTVLLLDGNYHLADSVTVDKEVVIRSATGSYRFSEAIINAGDIGNTAAIEFLGGSDGSVLQGLRFTGAVRTSSSQGTIRIGSGSGNDPHDVQILHNHLYQNQRVGISNHMSSGGSTGTVIAGNWIADHSGLHAIRIRNGLIDGAIKNNIIENVASAGINMDNATGFIIANNQFRNIGGHGMNLGTGTDDFTVSGNLLDHTNTSEREDGGGIRLYGASHETSAVITGNTVTNSFNNIYQRDGNISGSNITIENNTIVSAAAGSWLIYNSATEGVLDAQGNWFGSAEEDDFKDSMGGAVADNVDYSDWLTSAP